MKIESVKEGSKKSLVIKDIDVDEKDYELQMLINNKISGLVPIHLKTINNQSQLIYDLTNRISMRDYFSRRLISAADIKNLISQLMSMSDSAKQFLLNVNNIVLDVDKIFFCKQTGKYEFIYTPHSEEDIHEKLKILFNNMLDIINHNDRLTVKVAYSLQREATISDLNICDLQKIVERCYREEQQEEQEENESVKEDDKYIAEIEQKEGIWSKFLAIFKRNKSYKTSEELDNEDIDKIVQTEDFVDEDATMLLTSMGPLKPIILKSVNMDEEVKIMPTKFPCIIGKSKRSCDYVIDSPVISRVHARIIEQGNEYYLEDLNSTNNTYVNDIKIKNHEPVLIQLGDQISFADLLFIVD